MVGWRRPMQVTQWRWCAPLAWPPGIPRRRSVSSASPRRMRSTALSRWRAWWWMANFGSFASRQMAPTTGRLRVWPRKRRMQPWWTSPLWLNRPHPAWTPKRLLLLTKFLNHSASSWETKWWQTHQILPCWKPWPSAMSDHTSSRRKIRMRVRRFSTLGRPRRWSWGRPHSVIQSNLQRLIWPRWRKQSHWRQKSLGRCRLGLWVWQTKRLWEPRCSDSWTWSTTKSAWSYLDGPGASILQAQTSIEKAREQNLAMQARGQKMAADLHLIPEPRSFWTDRARSAFEQNVFAPEFEMDDAMAIDHEAVITEYKEMKGFLQSSNTRQFAPKLYSSLQDSPSWLEELELHPLPLHRGGREEASGSWVASSPREDPWWFLGPLWWGALLAEADLDLDSAGLVPRLWQRLDHERAVWHLVWDALDDPTFPQGSGRNGQGTPGQFAEDQGWGAAVPGCQQPWKTPVPGRVAPML